MATLSLGLALLLTGCADSADTVIVSSTQPQAAEVATSPPITSSPPEPEFKVGTTTTTSAAPTTTTMPAPAFAATVHHVDAAIAARMESSWREGCPVPLEDLRLLEIAHFDMEGEVRTGELVVHEDHADAMVEVFGQLFELEYPIEQMRLVDEFGADDMLSMQANNTSAFNCRFISGTSRWSEHAYGRAIDVNPLINPWVQGSWVSPPEGTIYVDRTQDAPGLIREGDGVVEAFAAAGWEWGGYWSSSKDYQHFSANGR